MSSSSWRVIRAEPAAGEGTASPTAPAAIAEPAPAGQAGQAGQAGHAAVLRGTGRPSGSHAGHRGPGNAFLGQAGAYPPGLGLIDGVDIAEQLRALEAEAEQRGYEAGRARGAAEFQGSVVAAGALAARLQELAPDRTSDIAHAIAELALSVAKRILQHEVRSDPSSLCNALEAAVKTINGSPEAHVLLNPAVVDRVREAWEALHGRAYLGKRWVFEGDPNLPVGGCTLRYEHGFVEAGLESQLEEIGIALDRAIPALSRATADEDVA